MDAVAVAVVGPMAQIILEIPPLPSLSSSTRPPAPLWLSLLGRRRRRGVMEISIAVGGGDPPVIDAGIESKFDNMMMMMTTTLDGAGW